MTNNNTNTHSIESNQDSFTWSQLIKYVTNTTKDMGIAYGVAVSMMYTFIAFAINMTLIPLSATTLLNHAIDMTIASQSKKQDSWLSFSNILILACTLSVAAVWFSFGVVASDFISLLTITYTLYQAVGSLQTGNFLSHLFVFKTEPDTLLLQWATTKSAQLILSLALRCFASTSALASSWAVGLSLNIVLIVLNTIDLALQNAAFHIRSAYIGLKLFQYFSDTSLWQKHIDTLSEVPVISHMSGSFSTISKVLSDAFSPYFDNKQQNNDASSKSLKVAA